MRCYRFRCFLRCLLLLVTVFNISTPDAGAANSPYRLRSKSSQNRDPGVDLATVNDTTYLLSEPYTFSERIARLRKGEVLVLVSRDNNLGWLNVIQFSSGHQGWVKANQITLHYTRHPNKYIDLPAQFTMTNDPPVINVKNQSNTHIYLHIGSLKEIDVDPNSSQDISVSAGITAYNASAPNMIPSFGKVAFVNGGQYTWRFWIKDATGSQDHTDVSLTEKWQFENLQREIERKTSDLKREKISLDREKFDVDQKYEKWESDKQLLDIKRSTIDDTDQMAVLEYNNLVFKTNSELRSYQSALDFYNLHVHRFNMDISDLESLQSRLDRMADSINNR